MLALARRTVTRAPLMARGLAYPSHTVVPMPALSPTMTQGNIAKYVAAVGDTVAAGDRLAEIETDKATVDFEMVDDGVLAKILIPEGAQDVPVGTPMVVLCDDAADVAAFADFTVDGGAPAAPAAAAPAPAAAAAPPPPPPPSAAPPAAAAAPPPTAVAGVAMPATSGRIYWSPTKGWYRA